MINPILALLLPLMLLGSNASAQLIRLPDYGISVLPKKAPDTIIVKSPLGYDIKLYIEDMRGQMQVEVYSKGKLLEKGSFANSLDTLKGYAVKKQIPGSQMIIVETYFQPLKNGVWEIFDIKRKRKKNVTFSFGVISN